MVGEQMLQGPAADLADRQRIIEAAPAALMQWLHAEQRQRGDRPSGEQRIAQLKKRIPASPKGSVGRRAKCGQRDKVSSIHTPYSATPRRLPETIPDRSKS